MKSQRTVGRSMGLVVTMLAMSFGATISAQAQEIPRNADLYAYIYEGTCAAEPPRDARVARIGELDSFEVDGLFDRDDVEEQMGLPRNGEIFEEDRDFRATLEELTGAPHVVIVRDGDELADPVVLCGEIAGEPENGILRIDLAPVGDSNLSGIALFEPERTVFGTDVIEAVVQVQLGASAATPAA